MRYIVDMHVITRKRLLEFSRNHANSASAIESWHKIMKHTNFDTFVQLRKTFPSADRVGKLTVFNIGGNEVRLIAAVHYNTNRIYIRSILTHAEYSKGKWRGIE